MNSISTIVLFSASAAVLVLGAAFMVTCIKEGETTALRRSAWITFTLTGLLLCSGALPENSREIVIFFLACVMALITIVFFLPVGQIKPEIRHPDNQVDEREIIFARARLEPGTEHYADYYQEHPDHKGADDASRKQPGLFSPQARLTDPLHSASAQGSFFLTDALREAVNGPTALDQLSTSPENLTWSVKYLTRFYGALDCGITELKPLHIYSHIGRGTGSYGDPVILNHRYGIAFTVEMDFKMTGAAPYPPITMESGRQYVESARIAVQLAAAIRTLGYPARAHIDGNYRIIAPLVARDAGLGEISRMGLLMTPHLGPRVRIGVVTTDLPLIPDSYQPEPSTLDFCSICNKCAENCPSQSIPRGNREVDNGVTRWKIIPETCYHYWTTIGTDCGRCLAVCPFSHPDNWAHNLVRWGISRSGTFRRAALLMDNFFYGKKTSPQTKKGPSRPEYRIINIPVVADEEVQY